MWAKIMVGDFVNLGEFNANSVIQAELESLAASVSGSTSSAAHVKAGRPVEALNGKLTEYLSGRIDSSPPRVNGWSSRVRRNGHGIRG